MSSEKESQASEDDVMKILLATDIHLGYNEKDPIRGDDSFITFEEILQNAVSNDVDFILLGGDLFHDAKPTPSCLDRCMKLLRNYTLGDKPITIEFLSDQSVNFMDSMNQTVNYEDPNINVAYPVFSIHGNHDDPTGYGRLSSLDLLSTNGLINYFGKWTDLTRINMSPILLKKGITQLALYGLSYIHDNRLARLFIESKVVLNQPSEETDIWFNMLVLHQNRADRGPKNFLPEEVLPDFLHLVMWGHEHDCRIIPEKNVNEVCITQPGSSVATSLSDGEAIDKHIGLLTIYKKKFKLYPIKLKTVRPFVFDTINLTEYEDELELNEGEPVEKIKSFLTTKIDEMIIAAKNKESGVPSQPTCPLIRLRVLYNIEGEMFNAIRFGQNFKDKVANPLDILLFKKKPNRFKLTEKRFDESALGDAFEREHKEDDDEVNVYDIIDRYFQTVDEPQKLEILYPKSMSEIVRRMVNCEDDDAAEHIIDFHENTVLKYLNEHLPAEDDVTTLLAQLQFEQSDQIFDSALKSLDTMGAEKKKSRLNSISDDDDDDVVDLVKVVPTTSTTTPRGRNAANGTAATTTRGATKGGPRSKGGRSTKAIVAKSPTKPSRAIAKKNIVQPSVSSFSTRSSQRQTTRSAIQYTQYISDDSD